MLRESSNAIQGNEALKPKLIPRQYQVEHVVRVSVLSFQPTWSYLRTDGSFFDISFIVAELCSHTHSKFFKLFECVRNITRQLKLISKKDPSVPITKLSSCMLSLVVLQSAHK